MAALSGSSVRRLGSGSAPSPVRKHQRRCDDDGDMDDEDAPSGPVDLDSMLVSFKENNDTVKLGLAKVMEYVTDLSTTVDNNEKKLRN